MATPYELGTSPHPPAASPSSGAKFGVFILVIAAIAAGAWFYISRRDPGGATPEPVAQSAETAPSPTPAPSVQPVASASPVAAKPGQPTGATSPAGQPRARRSVEPRAAGNDPLPTPSQTPVAAPPAAVAPAPPAAVANPVPERAAPPAPPSLPAPDPRIYDTATLDVRPPSLLTPIGIAPVRTNYVPGLATIEVIVSDDGSVLSAKSGRPPATLGETLEMMNWLSTAKSWRFGAAIRNGKSVKYRLVVPLSALVSGQGIR